MCSITERHMIRESTHTILGKGLYVCDSNRLFTACQKMGNKWDS